ncbi:MAG: hypothetical protein K8S56_04425, partial [Candidatus Cloacimonetes bacterium]|nr:hypothetical protein [Candidatus Cloacimonadota bacterium]
MMYKKLLIIIVLSCTLLWAAERAQTKEDALIQDLQDDISVIDQLAAQKKQIEQLAKAGRMDGVQNSFENDSRDIDVYLQEDKEDESQQELVKLKMLYCDYQPFDDEFLYYDALIEKIRGNNTSAIKQLEKLISHYPGTSKFRSAIIVLGELYIANGMSSAFLALHNTYQINNTSQQKFWLGNAYYMQNKHEVATPIFESLLLDHEYGLKSRLMLALISFSEYGAVMAKEEFILILGDYLETEKETPDIDFIYLSLGRIYHELQDYDKALYCYTKYEELTKDPMPNELLYEVFILSLNQGDLNTATYYLTELVKQEFGSDYFNSYGFLAAELFQKQGELDQAEQYIGEAVSEIRYTDDLIATKKQVVNRIKKLHADIRSNPGGNTDAEASKLIPLEDALRTSTTKLDTLGLGLTSTNSQRMLQLEVEYLKYQNTIDEMIQLIFLAESSKNTKIPRLIHSLTDGLDDDLIIFQTMKYVSNLEGGYTIEEYQLANLVAAEIHFSEQLLESWREIKTLAEKAEKFVVMQKAEKNVVLMEETVQAYQDFAISAFGRIDDNDGGIQQLLSAEIGFTKQTQRNWAEISALAHENWNRVMAKRLRKEKDSIEAESVNIEKKLDTKIKGDGAFGHFEAGLEGFFSEVTFEFLYDAFINRFEDREKEI